jgi:hypothetical protein
MGMAFAIPLQKTHELSFEPRKVCYAWHRWYGQTILTRRAGGAHAEVAYFCKLPEAPLDAMLVEIPKWMFDAAHCATMRLVDDPQVDCWTLRNLKNTILEQRVSVKAVVLQPQVYRQAGDGDTDDIDSPSKSNDTAGAVRRTGRRAKLERSHRADAERCSQTTGATAHQCSDKQASSRLSRTRRAG